MMLFDSGIKPPGLTFEVTPEMRRASMDKLGELLIRHASTEQRRALSTGHQRLRDLEIWDQVYSVIDASLKNSLALPSSRSGSLPVLEVLDK